MKTKTAHPTHLKSSPVGTVAAGVVPSTTEVDPLADIVAGTATPVDGHPLPGGLRSPLWRLTITSPFGHRIHPVLGTARFHRGTDYGARTGTPVRAAAAGTVVWASELGPYGILVVIAHAPDLHTAYAHLDSTGMCVGQRVRSGSRIGRVGATGMATGPHVHFEVRAEGTPVDPSDWITKRLSRPTALADRVVGRFHASVCCSYNSTGQ